MMVKKKHKEYKLENLVEGSGRMIDPCVNPNKDDYSDDEELGINPNITHKGHRWKVDTFKEKTGPHKTPQLKDIIRECLMEVLQESMTAIPGGVKWPKNLDNLMELSFAISQACNDSWDKFSVFDRENFYKTRKTMDIFTPDGTSNFDNPTGIINFYTSGMTTSMIKSFLKDALFFLKAKNIKFDVKLDKSKMYDSDVYRINITENPNKHEKKPPSIQYSNSNMDRVLKALGYDKIAEDYGGEIDSREFLQRTLEILNTQQNLSPYTRDSRHPDRDKFLNKSGETKGPKIYDPGLSEDDLIQRIKNMQQLALWSIKNGNGTMSIG